MPEEQNMKRLNKENKNIPEEVEKDFEKVWRKQVHYIDWKRFEKLGQYFKGGKYLDIGCFNSPYPYELTRIYKDSEIHAIDHAKKVVDYMKSVFPEVRYACGDIMNLPYLTNYFDYVVAGEILEHMDNPSEFLKEAFRVLQKGGILALSTPFEECISQKAIDPKQHMWAFTISDIQELLSPFGEIEVTLYEDTITSIIAYVKKI